MIEEKVRNLADETSKFWSQLVGMGAHYNLDYLWPSVGVVDFGLCPLFANEVISASDREVIRGFSAYIGCMAHESWSLFARDVKLVLDVTRGVVLSGVDEKGSFIEVDIEEELCAIIPKVPNPFPVIGDFSRFVTSDNNVISLFVFGLMFGLSPFSDVTPAGATGPRKKRRHGSFSLSSDNLAHQPLSNHKNRIEKVCMYLAKQSAECYSLAFPDEPLGQKPELYLHGLVFPPFFMNECFPASFSAKEVLEYCNKLNISMDQLGVLAQNLSFSPDEQISSIGIVVSSALAESVPQELAALSEIKGRSMVMLRSALVEVRRGLGLGDDWIGKSDISEADIARFRIETILGYLPLVRLGESTVRRQSEDPRISELLKSLVALDIHGAKKICDQLISETPGDIEIRLQRLYFDFIQGNFPLVQDGLRALLTEPGAEEEAKLFGMWGMLNIGMGEHEDAVRHLEMATRLATSGHRDKGYLLTNYAWALWLNQQYSLALTTSDEAIRRSPSPFIPMANKVEMLRELKRTKDAADLLQELIELSPLHRRTLFLRLSA